MEKMLAGPCTSMQACQHEGRAALSTSHLVVVLEAHLEQSNFARRMLVAEAHLVMWRFPLE
jgi:hypothetical protein